VRGDCLSRVCRELVRVRPVRARDVIRLEHGRDRNLLFVGDSFVIACRTSPDGRPG
jgi:hypothetical protein